MTKHKKSDPETRSAKADHHPDQDERPEAPVDPHTNATVEDRTLHEEHFQRELAAIKARAVTRRRDHKDGVTHHFDGTDLADLEWLIFELDRALGNEPVLTPTEQEAYDALTEKRNRLPPAEQHALNEIGAKHGELTVADSVKLDYIHHLQDANLSDAELAEWRRLDELAQQAK